MYKRVIALFSILMTCICILIFNIYNISQGEWLSQAANSQNTYRLDIARLRGEIYDCRKNKLVETEQKSVAAVVPCIESKTELVKKLSNTKRESILTLCSSIEPFAINLTEDNISAKGIDIFKVPIRYSDSQLCQHIIGYIDSSGKGICGIEKAYNDYLSKTGAKISVKYDVDALGRLLEGKEREIDDKSYLQTKGIVLTIDSRIQKIVEKEASKNLDCGAVVITEVPSCKIRACASFPGYSVYDIEKALNDERSPFLNRAIESYNVGSVFKLLTSAVAMEAGVSNDYSFECCGSIHVEDAKFNCFNGVGHEKVDMKDAIAYSCNSYFVDISKNIEPAKFLDKCKELGFGQSIELAPGYFSDCGNLPTEKQLKNPKTMANFSFGQGPLLATPIQISGLINAIASKGVYNEPSLVEGLVNENLDFVEKKERPQAKRVMSEQIANFLCESMKSAVEYGTSTKGKPENLTAAAKTATAETGLEKNGEMVEQAWYCGFYPADNPKYSIVVFMEDGKSGSNCGPTFKEIADSIYNQIPGSLID